ncbi:MAG: nuclear transport factor 2 family protein [Ferruginibacter sp.]
MFFSTTAFAQSKAQEEVEAKVQQLTKAMIDGDSATLDKLAADNLIYRHSNGHIDTKKDFVHKLASGESDFVTIDLTDPTISVINKNVVVVWHTLSAKTNDGGKPGEVNLYIMLVWESKKGSGNW